MKDIKICFDDCMVEQADILSIANRCLPAIEHVVESRSSGYESRYASVNLPFDEQLQKTVLELVHTFRGYDPAMLIVVGICGSNLGTKAIHEALFGTDRVSSGMCVHYVDTVDPDMIYSIVQRADKLLKTGNKIVLNIVTKSGTTTETIANGAVFIELVKQYYPDNYRDFILVTTDKDSKLYDVALEQGFAILEIPPMVGGRYSVFSAVGLFPLALMGVDIQALRQGAAHMVELCTDHNLSANYAAQSAAILYAMYQRGFIINNFFSFSVDLYALGLWCRQLVAESLGKESTITGQKVNIGITPTVSVGSTDLHSIVELHLGGPHNTVTAFIDIAQFRQTLSVPHCKPLASLVPHIQGKSFSTIMHAIFEGTKRAYKIANRPYMSVTFTDKSEIMLGQYMQWKMLETIYLGHLFNIDPFVQPQVELYKKETRSLLAHD